MQIQLLNSDGIVTNDDPGPFRACFCGPLLSIEFVCGAGEPRGELFDDRVRTDGAQHHIQRDIDSRVGVWLRVMIVPVLLGKLPVTSNGNVTMHELQYDTVEFSGTVTSVRSKCSAL